MISRLKGLIYKVRLKEVKASLNDTLKVCDYLKGVNSNSGEELSAVVQGDITRTAIKSWKGKFRQHTMKKDPDRQMHYMVELCSQKQENSLA